MKKQPQPIQTSVQCNRQIEGNQLFTRIDTFEDGKTSMLIMQHQKLADKDFLEINARDFSGLLTNSTVTQYMSEMSSKLKASDITSLKLVGLTNENCEADLFRRQMTNYILDGSFSKIREVVIESGYTAEEVEKYGLQPTTLPSKPFMKSELDFIKFDGLQIIPTNFLANTYSVANIVCPDNENTHEFLEPFKQESYINVVTNPAEFASTASLPNTEQ